MKSYWRFRKASICIVIKDGTKRERVAPEHAACA